MNNFPPQGRGEERESGRTSASLIWLGRFFFFFFYQDQTATRALAAEDSALLSAAVRMITAPMRSGGGIDGGGVEGGGPGGGRKGGGGVGGWGQFCMYASPPPLPPTLCVHEQCCRFFPVSDLNGVSRLPDSQTACQSFVNCLSQF